ncbi:acetoacetate--CoA ligase [Tsukamurella tyrosinosolvens]|uniref:acetoacetate--CoA ligase n=1 Tax=Tsukamurella tyrosinosolvens TaxID=57704 RepID=UPI000C7ECA29|nr:acetoacetate--CoA ligase [Tsukamurella tyrosinosolvens]AUN41860.1 acetoacetate--CoA ligase [Tsukamurella tyrosinosolvens]
MNQQLSKDESLVVSISRIDQFATYTGRPEADYPALYNWSVSDPEGFWEALWRFFELGPRTGPVLAEAATPGARWFPQQRVNYVAQVLRHADRGGNAIVGVGEDGDRVQIRWAELPGRVAAAAAALATRGVGVGDCVAGYLPDTPDAIVGFLAAASLGAMWAACGQDYAPEGAASRLAQLRPRVLVTCAGYTYGGKTIDKRGDIAALADALGLGPQDVLTTLPVPDAATPELRCVDVPFDHPLWVLFSSGTTGKPKGIVHGHGGVLLEHLKAIGLHGDIGPSDVFFWHTSPSWMMWNYRTGGLLTGATVVTYSGNPLSPTPDRLWELVEAEKVTYFGTSPGQLQASRDAGLRPGAEHALRVRTVGSTGSVLAPSLFDWITDNVGADVEVSSISGGTDVVSAFAGGTPGVKVVPGELSARYLGVALQAWHADATPVTDQVGELVITAPMPSMPVSFWNDPDGERYRAAYFAHEWADGPRPRIWRHGDWVEVTARGSVVIHGRSDATLNRNGIRMGSADIYEIVEALDDVAEALVVGVDGPDGTYWMPLFLTLHPEAVLDDQLVDRIRKNIRSRLSPRHIPDEVIAAPAIPHTRTGKKLEVPIAKILAGKDARIDEKSIDDPACLYWYGQIGRAHRW